MPKHGVRSQHAPEAQSDMHAGSFSNSCPAEAILSSLVQQWGYSNSQLQTPHSWRQAGSGGCFPIHFDSDEAVDARRLTAILYLSDPAWEPEWGGQLRLYPLDSEPVDILPAEVGPAARHVSGADLVHGSCTVEDICN